MRIIFFAAISFPPDFVLRRCSPPIGTEANFHTRNRAYQTPPEKQTGFWPAAPRPGDIRRVRKSARPPDSARTQARRTYSTEVTGENRNLPLQRIPAPRQATVEYQNTRVLSIVFSEKSLKIGHIFCETLQPHCVRSDCAWRQSAARSAAGRSARARPLQTPSERFLFVLSKRNPSDSKEKTL